MISETITMDYVIHFLIKTLCLLSNDFYNSVRLPVLYCKLNFKMVNKNAK